MTFDGRRASSTGTPNLAPRRTLRSNDHVEVNAVAGAEHFDPTQAGGSSLPRAEVQAPDFGQPVNMYGAQLGGHDALSDRVPANRRNLWTAVAVVVVIVVAV